MVLEILWHRVTAILTNVMAGTKAMFTMASAIQVDQFIRMHHFPWFWKR